MRSTSTEVAGLRLHALEAGTGRPVLLLASPLVLARTYRPLARRLARTRRVAVLELPGSGRSSRVAPPPGTEALAAAAAAWLDVQLDRRWVVVGHSNSAPVALALAALRPARVDRVVIADAVGARPAALGRILLDRARDAVREPALTVRGTPHLLANLLRHPRAFLAQVRASSALALHHAAAVRQPVLVAWGRRDRTMPLSCADRFRDALPCSAFAVGAGGHDWPIAHAREFAAALDGFASRPAVLAGSTPPVGDPADVARWLDTFARVLGERHPHDADHHRRLCDAADLVFETFREAGLEPRRERFRARGRPVENVWAELPGRRVRDAVLVVGAHLDTVRGSPGADDDASGLAAVLALAAAYGSGRLAPPPVTLRFAAFTTEEPPFTRSGEMGSLVHARGCRARDEDVVAMLSLECLGHLAPPRLHAVADRRSAALAHAAAEAFAGAVRCRPVIAPRWLPGVRSSDHGSFWKAGYRAAMLTDGGPLRSLGYHTRRDRLVHVDAEALAREVIPGVARWIAAVATAVARPVVAAPSARWAPA